MNPWAVVNFPFFVGVRHVRGEWTHVFIKPNVELDLKALGLLVRLSRNRIEFRKDRRKRAVVRRIPKAKRGTP